MRSIFEKLNIKHIIIFLIASNLIFIYSTVYYVNKIHKQTFKVYSFKGEGPEVRLNDGLIISAPGKETIIGGNIDYLGGKRENLISYSLRIYLRGSKTLIRKTLLSKEVNIDNNTGGVAFNEAFTSSMNKSLGETSSEKLFFNDELDAIKDNLYFELDYVTASRQTGSFIIKLNVKEFEQ